MSLQITSPAFPPGGDIPTVHTCEGKDRSPALQWIGPPVGTVTYALIVDDPDAPDPEDPQMTYVHWVLYNLPADCTGLPEGVTHAKLPTGTREGLNDWGRTGYGGPCPPKGKHRYFFKLYALDCDLPDLDKPTKAQLEVAMLNHILGVDELVGKYEKVKKKD